MYKPIVAVAFAMLSFVPGVRAAEQTLRLDPAACKVTFSLHATLHSAKGWIPVRQGEIRFDLATGRASGRVVLDARGATTEKKSRDEKMHEEVLESARFPEIVFAPTEARGALDANGSGTVSLVGTVSIHGADHPFTVQASVKTQGDRVTAEGAFTVPYVEWGMKDPSAFVMRVAKEVELHIAAVGTLSTVPAGEPAP